VIRSSTFSTAGTFLVVTYSKVLNEEVHIIKKVIKTLKSNNLGIVGGEIDDVTKT
jgi:hypothetical protein